MAGYTWLKDIERFEQDMARALKPLGKEAMLHAYKVGHTDAPRNVATDIMYKQGKGWRTGAQWRHKLGNLHDSFASAVYVNGVVVKSTIQYIANPISKKREPKTGKKGRQIVKDYLLNHSFGAKNNEIVLVVIAAMYYTKYLEDVNTGSGNFIVISPARDFINQRWWSYVEPVYKKHGLPTVKPKAKVIKGERLQ